MNPDKLSFQERLALHKRMADQGQPQRSGSANDMNVDSSQTGSDCISNHDQAHDSINTQTEEDRPTSPLESTLV